VDDLHPKHIKPLLRYSARLAVDGNKYVNEALN
jgi:hypothetical protein